MHNVGEGVEPEWNVAFDNLPGLYRVGGSTKALGLSR